MKNNQPSLPANRAFVVQLHADIQIEWGDYKGRVEHLNSGAAAHFASAEELLAFITRTLTAQQQSEAEKEEEAE